MATHFRWYGNEADMTVPFNRRYSYPSEANHAQKNVTKIPPKNKDIFYPGQDIKIDLPADGFLNPAATLLELDVTLTYTIQSNNDYSIIRLQNGVQSIFSRQRWEYGSSYLEDIQECNQLYRFLLTHTGTGQTGGIDQLSITDGVGCAALGCTGTWGGVGHLSGKTGFVNGRQAYIQGISLQKSETRTVVDDSADITVSLNAGNGFGLVPNSGYDDFPGSLPQQVTVTRRYQIPLMIGILQQPKLYPLKYTAQNSIILTLESAAGCIFWQKGEQIEVTGLGPLFTETLTSTASTIDPSYYVSNVALITETLHFDAAYNESFQEGLREGVPIKFNSYNHFQFSTAAASTQTLSIPENNRSIKAVFVTQNRNPKTFETDSGASFFNTYNPESETCKSSLAEFQFRVGTKVYPTNPIQCKLASENRTNGGGEAYTSLAKALNMLGDQRLSTTSDIINWAGDNGFVSGGAIQQYQSNKYLLNEYDGKYSVQSHDKDGRVSLFECESPTYILASTKSASHNGRCFAGNWTSAQFVMAIGFETSNGLEVSGLNAQEQSDIHITMKWTDAQATGFQFNVWTYYDAMIILMERNVIQLVK